MKFIAKQNIHVCVFVHVYDVGMLLVAMCVEECDMIYTIFVNVTYKSLISASSIVKFGCWILRTTQSINQRLTAMLNYNHRLYRLRTGTESI